VGVWVEGLSEIREVLHFQHCTVIVQPVLGLGLV
jgi:hypothetical protein